MASILVDIVAGAYNQLPPVSPDVESTTPRQSNIERASSRPGRKTYLRPEAGLLQRLAPLSRWLRSVFAHDTQITRGRFGTSTMNIRPGVHQGKNVGAVVRA